MGKIIINLNLDEDNNITIINSKSNNKIFINYQNKLLNAKDVYDVFDYDKDTVYEITSNIEEVSDIKMKEYFKDIISLFENIKKELNEFTFNENKDVSNDNISN